MGVELRNCTECGRLFAYEGKSICNRCLDREDVKYSIVRKYVRENPGASIIQVAEATKIEESIVLHMVKDGRLKVGGYTAINNCVRCGKRISEGTYCETCLSAINKELRMAIEPGEEFVDEKKPKGKSKSRQDKMYVRHKK
ncbi:MAG: hypothetical protein LBK69_08005 [Syntrophomonadaceae bacterium]|nr:hypothetical protein [Syntrophomonadaceae bacterium]